MNLDDMAVIVDRDSRELAALEILPGGSEINDLGFTVDNADAIIQIPVAPDRHNRSGVIDID